MWVGFAERRFLGRQKIDVGGLWLYNALDRRRGANCGWVGLIDRDLREARGTQRRADFAAAQIDQRRFDRRAYDPAPICRTCAAADYRQLRHLRARVTQGIEPIRERESNALKHRLRECAGLVS
jgi:hypothetical protein